LALQVHGQEHHIHAVENYAFAGGIHSRAVGFACCDRLRRSANSAAAKASRGLRAVKSQEEARAAAENEKSQKESSFSLCLSNANLEYQRAIEANGTRTGKGTYSLPVVTLREFDRQKQSKIEECKLLYR